MHIKNVLKFLYQLLEELSWKYQIKKQKKAINFRYKTQNRCYVKPLNWCKIKFLKNSSSIIVLCNYKFL